MNADQCETKQDLAQLVVSRLTALAGELNVAVGSKGNLTLLDANNQIVDRLIRVAHDLLGWK